MIIIPFGKKIKEIPIYEFVMCKVKIQGADTILNVNIEVLSHDIFLKIKYM